jgi:hypothetical protein
MTEIQEKAVKIALRSYGNGCMNDEDFIDILNAILYHDHDEPYNRFQNGLINTPGILTPRDITNPTKNPTKNPGDVWVTYAHHENSNTSINKNIKDVKIPDYPDYTTNKQEQATFKN